MNLKIPHYLMDGYKTGHRRQYPEGTTFVYSNLTARSSRVTGCDKTVLFGLQYFIKRYLIEDWNENFFSQPKDAVVKTYKRRLKTYLGTEPETSHIEALHDLGYLPIKIKALPEGAKVNIRVPMVTIENTHPEFFWLTNALETILSNTLWLPITSATTATLYKEILEKWADKTAENRDFVPFQMHDFSMRGHSSLESSCLSGAAHLLSAVGTDTIPAIDFLEQYYNADAETEFIGCSVEATEHSVACVGSDYSSGKGDDLEHFRRMITEVVPTGIVSLVSDTFDFWRVINPENGILKQLKEVIENRDGKVVIRPDSGDPVHIVTGYVWEEIEDPKDFNYIHDKSLYPIRVEVVKYQDKYYRVGGNGYGGPELVLGSEMSSTEVKGLIECLYEIFGGIRNQKGYIDVSPCCGGIYGDSITLERAERISSRLANKGFSSTNIVYGIGSFTYQGAITPNAIVTRDTFGMAVKATFAVVNGEGKEIYKDPVTDCGLKKSAKGLLRVDKVGNDYILTDQVTPDREGGELKVVFEDGKLIKDWTLEEIRNNLKES